MRSMSTKDDNIILFSCIITNVNNNNKCYWWGGVGGPQDCCVTNSPLLGFLGLNWVGIGLGMDLGGLGTRA